MNLTLFASIFALLINQSFACDCGRPDYTMMGRSKGLLSRFPWYVVIENKNLKSCGAALIDDQHAVIAAHCLSGSDASSLGARLNDNSTKSIASIWVDERYNNETGAYDFAVFPQSARNSNPFVC
ncbi:trypsin beta-like [Tetranychus urticae]|uniref:trypsin beta-like n=1 Tax=Tetranychus urticae TaxID=32264 RepID=UPI00077B9723|nr:trypsin beta-like [Tetranychus urticae]